MDTEKQIQFTGNTSKKIHELAEELDKFMYDYDSYEYWDNLKDKEGIFREIQGYIRIGKTEAIKLFLQEIANDEDSFPVHIVEAKKFLHRLNEIERKLKTDNKHN